MALMNDRIRSVGKAELMNLTPLDINPGISKCEIAVAYEGKNRNGSYISHEEMEDLGRTMRGIPIVGYYSESKGDFRDHGHRITIDSEGITEEITTVPYGFISPDADVWFQEVVEDTKFGSVKRTYLMCTGYLWTESFPEAKLALEQGRPQSMELSNERLQGRWAEIDEYGMEFFIIEKGSTLSKLCILGSDVPPCFESAEVTAPQISKNFSLMVSDDIMSQFARMTEELKFALSAEGGLNSVEDENKNIDDVVLEFEDAGESVDAGELGGEVTDLSGDAESGQEEAQDAPSPLGGGLLGTVWSGGGGSGSGNTGNDDPDPGEGGSESGQGTTGGNNDNPADPGTGDTPGSGDEPGSGDTPGAGDDPDDPSQGGGVVPPSDDDEHKNQDELDSGDVDESIRRRRMYSDEEIEAMVAELDELRQFKASVEEAEKDKVIAKYSMLSDDEKADVIDRKHEYTAQEIDEKLALVYVRKNVAFDADDAEDENEGVNTTFSLDFDSNTEYVPQMVSALRRTRQNNKR